MVKHECTAKQEILDETNRMQQEKTHAETHDETHAETHDRI